MKSDDKILEEIKKNFIEIHNNSKANGRRDWTQEFLKKLIEIGKKNGYNVCPDYEIKESQWLFDLCWLREKKREKWIEGFLGLKLICEIEWSSIHEEIIYDFHKLSVAKADIKLMVAQCYDEVEFFELKKIIENSVDMSLIGNDLYFLVVSENCKNGELKFCPLWK